MQGVGVVDEVRAPHELGGVRVVAVDHALDAVLPVGGDVAAMDLERVAAGAGAAAGQQHAGAAGGKLDQRGVHVDVGTAQRARVGVYLHHLASSQKSQRVDRVNDVGGQVTDRAAVEAKVLGPRVELVKPRGDHVDGTGRFHHPLAVAQQGDEAPVEAGHGQAAVLLRVPGKGLGLVG